MSVRAAKTTKEIDVSELEQLKKPEARETAAFDPTELQGLVAQMNSHDDDLALPVERAPASSAEPMAVDLAASSGLAPMVNDFDDDPGHYSEVSSPTIAPRVARGSASTPKSSKPIARPSSLVPWILVALAIAIVSALAFWR
jgi:hypothetical protein